MKTKCEPVRLSLRVLMMIIPWVLGGCRREPFRVDVPHGFMGTVQIECLHKESSARLVKIGPDGRGAAVCPKEGTKVIVVRDGKDSESARQVEWIKAGDGLVVEFRFTLR
jgi:hypothetical protein